MPSHHPLLILTLFLVPSLLNRGQKWESLLREGWKLFTEMAYLVQAGSTVDVNELQFIVGFVVIAVVASAQ